MKRRVIRILNSYRINEFMSEGDFQNLVEELVGQRSASPTFTRLLGRTSRSKIAVPDKISDLTLRRVFDD